MTSSTKKNIYIPLLFKDVFVGNGELGELIPRTHPSLGEYWSCKAVRGFHPFQTPILSSANI